MQTTTESRNYLQNYSPLLSSLRDISVGQKYKKISDTIHSTAGGGSKNRKPRNPSKFTKSNLFYMGLSFLKLA